MRKVITVLSALAAISVTGSLVGKASAMVASLPLSQGTHQSWLTLRAGAGITNAMPRASTERCKGHSKGYGDCRKGSCERHGGSRTRCRRRDWSCRVWCCQRNGHSGQGCWQRCLVHCDAWLRLLGQLVSTAPTTQRAR